MTVLSRLSKACTAFLCEPAGAGAAALIIDDSQERTNLVNQTTYADEASSARTAIDAPRTISIVVDMRSTDSRPLVHHGSAAATYSYRISLAASSVIQCHESGVLRVSATMPGMVAGARKVLIHWAQRVEGASVVSELMLYNFTTAEYAFASATHAAVTPGATDTLTIGASFGGAMVYTGGAAAFYAVRIGRRFVSRTEAKEDFIAESSPVPFTGYDRTPALTAASSDLVIAGEGQFAGPSFLMAGAATRQAGQRCVGHFVNENIRSPATELHVTDAPRFYRPTPDGWGKWCARYIRHGYLSPKVNVAQVFAHVRAFDALGGGATISPVYFRAYSVANLPLAGQAPVPMTYHRGPIVGVDTVTAAGAWIDLGVVRLARDDEGRSVFCLGFFLDPAFGEGVTFTTAWQLNGQTVTPFAKNLSGGGFGGDLDKEAP